MHIPDGYLSPQTYVPLYAASGAFWAVALKKLKRQLSSRQVPYLSMAAAFSFLIMMFNVPIPGGTTGHAVGGAIIAILLGPWTAVIAVSVVLIIQALVFGDGGITAIGANCFNMAIVLPFVSYGVFRLLNGRAKGGPRLYVASFLAGYIGLAAAAFFAGVEFGIQPLIAKAADGTPLYAPYPLSVALPAMVLQHLAVFGLIEGAVTALLLKYFMRQEAGLAFSLHGEPPGKSRRRLWLWLAVIAVLTPMGLIIPKMFGAGGAWGEWGPEALKDMIGYVPKGLARLGELWNAPLADYGFGGGASPAMEYLGYIISALIGILMVGIIFFIFTKVLLRLAKKRERVRTPFLDKGIRHLAKIIRTSYLQWESSRGNGLFQGLDARVKILFLLAFLVVVSLKKNIGGELAVAALIFVFAAASRLNLKAFYGRILLLGFFFGFIIALPSSLNVITPGEVVLPLFSLGSAHSLWMYSIPKDIGITREGLRGVAMLTLRVSNSVSISLLVLYTTPFTELMRALKVFRVPDTFIMVINLAYKYVFIFARTVEEMHLAKKSRLAGAVEDKEARKWIAGRIALVFRKTQLKCEEIYKAMVARGFSGEVSLSGFPKAGVRDYAAAALLVAAGAALLLI